MKYTSGLRAGAMPSGTTEVLDEEPVTYTNMSNCSVNNDGDLVISSTSPASWSNGASGVQSVENGEYIQFEVPNTPAINNYVMVGLSYTNTNHHYNTINYAWYLYMNGSTAIWEDNAQVGGSGAYTPGDLYKLVRDYGTIRYYKNGVLIRSVADASPGTPMVIDISLYRPPSGPGCKVFNLVVGKWKTLATYDAGDYISYITGDDYRYAYNGMEQDNEVKGNGNSYTTEFRQYDPRLGRWLSLDPLMSMFPWMSPYVAFDDNPIYYTDPYGLSAGPGDGEKQILGSEKQGSDFDGAWVGKWEKNDDGTYKVDENGNRTQNWYYSRHIKNEAQAKSLGWDNFSDKEFKLRQYNDEYGWSTTTLYPDGSKNTQYDIGPIAPKPSIDLSFDFERARHYGNPVQPSPGYTVNYIDDLRDQWNSKHMQQFVGYVSDLEIGLVLFASGGAVMNGVPIRDFIRIIGLGRTSKKVVDVVDDVTTTGTTVLGKYPNYINLASKLNARRFNIPTKIWNKMSPSEQWAANVKFLDRTIARGDKILLSNPVKNINKVSGYLRMELDYLMSKGYKLNSNGTQLIK